jgi:pimeloyl-ACP methyl ester carboxylesterase
MLDPSQIETRYAKSGDLNIAYQVFGEGPVTLVYIPGWTSHIENAWTIPEHAEFMSKIAAFARVIFMDRRGTGLSDPVADPPTLEERMDDVRAVMDAAEKTWGTGEMSLAFAPDRAGDPAFIRALARQERASMSPGSARKLFRMLVKTEVRSALPSIRVSTLVLHRTGDQPIRIGHGRYLAQHIPGAKLCELPGVNHLPWVGDYNALLGEIREFLTGERAALDSDRILTTILFCDIAAHLGARVAGAAAPGEVLVTSTVKDLVVGSGLRFDDLGLRTLKGMPEEWRLFRATA